MARFAALLFMAVGSGASAYVTSFKKPFGRCMDLHGSKSKDVVVQQAFVDGTLVEFSEKGRVHVGRITHSEHKASGGARYDVEDYDGKHYQIADKAVSYSMPPPTSDRGVKQLFDAFAAAKEAPEVTLREELDISPELLEMAWEEAVEDETHELTPKSLIELVHSHSASAIEAYKAWRLMRTDMAHVFFKELKDHGRVVAFKAKARKAVDAAKQTFCRNPEHADDEFCWV